MNDSFVDIIEYTPEEIIFCTGDLSDQVKEKKFVYCVITIILTLFSIAIISIVARHQMWIAELSFVIGKIVFCVLSLLPWHWFITSVMYDNTLRANARRSRRWRETHRD